jgi:hypothetical protein
VHAFDGAAFVLPPLGGALAWVVCTLGAFVSHDANMGPNPWNRESGCPGALIVI